MLARVRPDERLPKKHLRDGNAVYDFHGIRYLGKCRDIRAEGELRPARASKGRIRPDVPAFPETRLVERILRRSRIRLRTQKGVEDKGLSRIGVRRPEGDRRGDDDEFVSGRELKRARAGRDNGLVRWIVVNPIDVRERILGEVGVVWREFRRARRPLHGNRHGVGCRRNGKPSTRCRVNNRRETRECDGKRISVESFESRWRMPVGERQRVAEVCLTETDNILAHWAPGVSKGELPFVEFYARAIREN